MLPSVVPKLAESLAATLAAEVNILAFTLADSADANALDAASLVWSAS